jgi:hypothetical protein
VSRYEVLFIRLSLAYLLATGFLGVVFVLIPALAATFRVTHVHLGVVGFFLSMVMGVAFWMMPRPGGLRQERLETLTFYLLHGGLLLRLVVEPWWYQSGNNVLKYLTFVSGLLQLAAMLVFAYAMNKRVVTANRILQARQNTLSKVNS